MTDTKKSDVGFMKVDKRGRVRTPAKRRESLLAEFDRSGVSARQFAELAGIKYQTFATWLQKRNRQVKPASPAANTVKWLKAVVEPCDMRKGFNGLHALVTERLGEDPRAGALFVFINVSDTPASS